jgi:predicted NBD/HSP70 family sugar kinase
MRIDETRGQFGFHLTDGKDGLCPRSACVQIYVKSSALSRVADLAISPRLMSATEVDTFIEQAIAALRAIGADAKLALEALEAA